MKVEQADDGRVHIQIGPIPAILVVFEAEAPPHIFGGGSTGDIQRITLGLTDEWKRVLLDALATDPRYPITEQED